MTVLHSDVHKRVLLSTIDTHYSSVYSVQTSESFKYLAKNLDYNPNYIDLMITKNIQNTNGQDW